MCIKVIVKAINIRVKYGLRAWCIYVDPLRLLNKSVNQTLAKPNFLSVLNSVAHGSCSL